MGKTKMLTVGIVTFIIGLLSGLFALAPLFSANQGITQAYSEDSLWRTDSIRVVGSTTVLPIANACALRFMEIYNTTSIIVEGGGSGRGYSELIDGLCDIADASREPKQSELDKAKQKGVRLILHEIAIDGIAIIVHPSVTQNLNGPLNLTLEEIGKIFAGVYSKWSEVREGLPDKEIVVFVREHGSGTRATFEEFCMEPFSLEVKTGASEVPSNPAMRQSVEQTPYSIGYVGLGFLSGNVEAVHVAEESSGPFYAPTYENVKNGVYPLSRYLYMVTDGIPESGSLTDRFIDFVKSPEGQRIVEQCGYIAIYPKE